MYLCYEIIELNMFLQDSFIEVDLFLNKTQGFILQYNTAILLFIGKDVEGWDVYY